MRKMKKTFNFILIIFLLIGILVPLYSRTYQINSLHINKVDYYPLYKILNILRLERYYDIYTRKIIIKDKGKYLTFFVDEDIVYYEMKTILLKYPPIRHEGIILIPQEMVDMLTKWKRGDYLFNYVNNNIKIDKKQEIIYKAKNKQKESTQVKSTAPAKSIARENISSKKENNYISKADKFKETPIRLSLANRIKVIIIDPGHGGQDPGAIGQKGLREKKVVLKTCLYLRDYLKSKTKNIKIIMTRDKDVFIPLEKRAKIANKYINKNTAGIFLSVHANASYNKKTKGTETFVLSAVASDDEARAVAAMENGIIDRKGKKADSISKILTGLLSYENIRESIQLAIFIQKSYKKNLNVKGTTPTGVKKALFYVLEGTLMPAALTEIGFLTNREEEKFLRKASYQKKVAFAIGDGIIKYINWYDANNGFIQ